MTIKVAHTKGYYAVVRHSSDGDDYIDLETISGSAEVSLETARGFDERLPHWAKDNKIAYLATFDMVITNITKVKP